MSEAMTVETIIDAYWQLQGYWTKLRYQYKIGKGWSDIDVIAYHPLKKELVIAESKVKGEKHLISAYTSEVRSGGISLIDFDRENDGNLDYLSFIENLNPPMLKEIYSSLNIPDETKIIVHLVSNYYIEESILNDAEKELREEIIKRIGSSYTVERVKIDTTFDVFCEIIKQEEKIDQGKRYGHPVIDISREINRYMNPKIVRKKSERKSETKVGEYKKEVKNNFKKKIGEALKLKES